MDCFLFEGLSAEEKISVLNLIGSETAVEKHGELYKKGHIGILKSGSAVIKRRGDIGNLLTVGRLQKGGVFGMATVFGEWREGLSIVTALTECKVYYIKEDLLKTLLLKYPAISLNYITHLTRKIRFLNRRIDALSAGGCEEKLYEFLLSEQNENAEVILSFGMAELSRRLKISRTSLYRGIAALENSGLVMRNKQNFKIL